MSWTNISNALVAVGAKPFATTLQALRDNVVAALEGAPGAPKVDKKALGGNQIGAVSGANWQGFVGLEDYSELHFDVVSVGNAGGVTTFSHEVRFSTDNGVSWGAAAVLVTPPIGAGSGTEPTLVHCSINLVSGTARGIAVAPAVILAHAVIASTLAVPVGVNGIQMRRVSSSNSATISMAVHVSGGREL